MIEVEAKPNDIAKLQIGEPAKIFQMPTIRDIKRETTTTPRKNPRFNKRFTEREPKKPEVIDFPRPHRSKKKKEQVEHSKLLTQIKSDQNLYTNLSTRLKRYDEVQRFKYNYMEIEHDDYYFKPWSERVRKEMNGDNYAKFLSKKEEAIKEADKKQIPIRSNRELHKIPTIRVSMKGLRDPHTKYKEKQRKEDELIRIIHSVEKPEEDENVPQNKVKEKRLDLLFYKKCTETRFYTGRQSDAKLHGKKLFKDKSHDTVSEDILTIPKR